MSLLSKKRPAPPTAFDEASAQLAEREQSSAGMAVRSVGRAIRRTVTVVGGMIATMGVVALVNAATGFALNRMFGLVPRTTSGAIGILLHPMLHQNWAHFAGNAVGLAMLGGLVMLREERDFWTVTLLGVLTGGIGTWLVGREALHIGASGVVFAYFGYLLTTGWFDRRFSSIAISLFAAVTWGSLLFGLSPVQQGISWELHAFGFIGGVLGARIRRARYAQLPSQLP